MLLYTVEDQLETVRGDTGRLSADEKSAHSSCLATMSSDFGDDSSSTRAESCQREPHKIRDGQGISLSGVIGSILMRLGINRMRRSSESAGYHLGNPGRNFFQSPPWPQRRRHTPGQRPAQTQYHTPNEKHRVHHPTTQSNHRLQFRPVPRACGNAR